jgi:hypothetical protein
MFRTSCVLHQEDYVYMNFLCFSCIYVSTAADGRMCTSLHLLDLRVTPTRGSSRWSVYFSFRKHLPHTWYMAYPSLPPRFGHSYDIWLGVQVMTPHIMSCSDVLGLNCRGYHLSGLSKTSLPLFGWWYAALFGCSPVNVMTGLQVRPPRNRVWVSGRDGRCFPSRRRLDQPSFSCSVDTGSSSSGVKRAGRDADHSPPSSDEVHDWSCNSGFLRAFASWTDSVVGFALRTAVINVRTVTYTTVGCVSAALGKVCVLNVSFRRSLRRQKKRVFSGNQVRHMWRDSG